MESKIFEDKYYQQTPKKTLEELNTEDQRKRGAFYKQRYDQLSAEMETREQEWNGIEKLYKCERTIIENAPNSFIPLISPIVNGQIASMTDQNISAKIKGKGYTDQKFAHIGQIITDFILKENKIKQKLKIGGKRYLLFGIGWFAMDFDPDALDGFGLPTIRCPQTTKVFIDGNIKDITDYQNAEYIIEEIGYKSIMWARDEYGDDKADYLMANSSDADFGQEILDDEKFSFKLLRVWTRNNKGRNLQLIEMDDTGFILYESDPESPYYEYVDNRYPYAPFGLYHEEGNFYRFGDGKLMKFMQETLNKLYDEVITACKFSAQGRIFVDPNAECDPDDFDADPSHPIIAKDPKTNIYVQQAGGINSVVFSLIQNLLQQAQVVSRFSALMSGNVTGENITATQAGIQNQQGNTGINDKKGDISDALTDVVTYCLGIAMELWTAGQAMRISDDSEDFEWIDARQLSKVPVMVPTDSKYEKEWEKRHPNTDKSLMPKFIQYVPSEDIKKDGDVVAKSGEPQTKKVAFDIDVSIGEGLPTNKLALYNIILSLAQLQLPDEQTGQMKPLMGYAQVRKMIEEIVGLPLEDAMEEAKKYAPMAQTQQSNVKPVNINPNIPGANMNGTMIGGSAS